MKKLPKVGDLVVVKKCIAKCNTYEADVTVGATYNVAEVDAADNAVRICQYGVDTVGQWVNISEIKKVK